MAYKIFTKDNYLKITENSIEVLSCLKRNVQIAKDEANSNMYLVDVLGYKRFTDKPALEFLFSELQDVNGVAWTSNAVFEDWYEKNTGGENATDSTLEFSKNNLSFNLLGRRSGFTSTSIFNDVKEFDNSVANIPNLSNSTLDIISSSVNDASAGTGVRTVKVTYLNTSNNIVESPAITLNGTTLVTSVLTGVNAVLWMETATAGSGDVAAGNIRLRINGGSVEVEQISTGGNKSMSGFFMIPSGYTGYVKCMDGTAIGTNQDIRLRATVNSLDRTLSTIYHYQDNLYLINGQQGDVDLPYLKFPPLCKIKASTISGATPVANRCDVSFQLILIQD